MNNKTIHFILAVYCYLIAIIILFLAAFVFGTTEAAFFAGIPGLAFMYAATYHTLKSK